jgi:hypothetical protein
MGLFDKLFGRNNKPDETPKPPADTTPPTKTADMMDEDKFWALIGMSLKATPNQDAQNRYLISYLAKLPPHEIIGFRLRTDYLLYQTYTSALWCAGYIMNGGCSDDSFEYFRCWIISRGKETYYQSKADPDYLAYEITKSDGDYTFEEFWYVALEAFERTTGKNLYDYIDDENFKTREGSYPEFEFTWQEDDPESRKKICPKLFERFR